MKLKALVGSGDRITWFTLPFVVVGLALDFLLPSLFTVGGPPSILRMFSFVVLAAGVVIWVWSVALILAKVPRHELITTGPYTAVKHPLYTAVALFVLPSTGFLLDTWLGLAVGIVMYVGSRIYAPLEERTLSGTFGARWDDYCRKVMIPWL
jgi:protein-S-isoprenylcysteine O-methyltransferase Ste14